jgi:hypothetical protein
MVVLFVLRVKCKLMLTYRVKKVIFSVYFIVWSKYLTLIFKVSDQRYHFWILFKFNVNDENQYYGLMKISPGNVWRKCLRISYKNNSYS